MKNSFSILLVFCILTVLGLFLIPRLDIGNAPRPKQGHTLTISFKWNQASAKVIEQNVTSRIEAVASSVRGVEKVSSVSRFGRGQVVVELKPKADVSAIKFELASIIRQMRNQLPEGISYPTVTGGEVDTALGDDDEEKHILTYQLHAAMSGAQIRQTAQREAQHQLERIEGVAKVDITGAPVHYMEVTYDAAQLSLYGLTANDMAEAIRQFVGRENVLGKATYEEGTIRIPLLLSVDAHELTGHQATTKRRRFEEIPLKTIGNKIIYLNHLASCTWRERKPDSYYRVNGMNTVYMKIYAEKGVRLMEVAGAVKETVSGLGSSFQRLHPSLSYDRAEEQMSEFRNLVMRSSLTLLILLLFVWLSGGCRWRYLLVITLSLITNILIASGCYWLLNLRLHPFSMAGITISLGILIDAAIVMTDHYANYHNRKAFTGISAAMLTTVSALIMVFWLPDYLQADLSDFSVVMIVNLSVALLVAFFFTPALISRMGFSMRRPVLRRSLRTRWLSACSRTYLHYVKLTQRPWLRTGLLFVFAALFAFSLRSFVNHLEVGTFRPKEPEKKLLIRASMPVGGSVHELNDKVMQVEAFLSQYQEIKQYETTIRQRGASIVVSFQEEALHSSFPYLLENQVIGKIITIGGADWATSGVSERGFSNSLNLQHRSSSIEISGYDYGRLYRYAEDMCRELSKNGRVADLAIVTPGHEQQEDEFFMEYDETRLAIDSIYPQDIYNSLKGMLSVQNTGKLKMADGEKMDVVASPWSVDAFDLWQLQHAYIRSADRSVRPSAMMNISKRKAKNIIPRNQQEYVLRVAFNVLGSYTYTSQYIKDLMQTFSSRFPAGFRCVNKSYGAYEDDGTQYWLIGLVAVVIFFILAILFESLWQSLAVTLLIPVSFIGLFLTYSVLDIPFGTGGFAAMVLLAGLTVNAGIYILCQYRMQARQDSHAFLRAFNHKIIPVVLTVLSTILGMIPFLIDGADEQPFWFSLAVGTIGGLMPSILFLALFLPAVLRLKKD